ncbi:hypothetical protein I3760_02G142900 [Carya illinoinensis]|nr:hypothetical protein I3760_02G142900 [Carya illinoinensis]
MTTSLTQRLFLLQLVILSLSIISTNARPCKTLFISSYSFSFKQNPSSSGVVTVLSPPRSSSFRSTMRCRIVQSSSSLRDRTKDILSVVVALLFGVGCGALTAATMYLA